MSESHGGVIGSFEVVLFEKGVGVHRVIGMFGEHFIEVEGIGSIRSRINTHTIDLGLLEHEFVPREILKSG